MHAHWLPQEKKTEQRAAGWLDDSWIVVLLCRLRAVPAMFLVLESLWPKAFRLYEPTVYTQVQYST
jgi:hypothetical protein